MIKVAYVVANNEEEAIEYFQYEDYEAALFDAKKGRDALIETGHSGITVNTPIFKLTLTAEKVEE